MKHGLFFGRGDSTYGFAWQACALTELVPWRGCGALAKNKGIRYTIPIVLLTVFDINYSLSVWPIPSSPKT
jgi:hypothetical protein